MIAQEVTEGRDLDAPLGEAQREIARLSAELQARTEELEKARAAVQPDTAPIAREIKRRFGRFIADRVNPGYEERHHGDLSSWPPELFRAAGEIGLTSLGADRLLGGDGRDPFTTGVAMEEIAKLLEEPGFLYLTLVARKIANLVGTAGDPEQIDRYARSVVKGEGMAAWAPFDAGNPGYPVDLAFQKSVARKVDEKWVLSGSKGFALGAGYATVFLVTFWMENSGETMLFLIHPDDPGVTITPADLVAGRQLGPGTLTLAEVKVGDERRLALDDVDSAIRAHPEEITHLCAIYLGWTQRMLDMGIEALRPRVRGGQSFLSIPQVQGEIGRIHAGIEAARSLFLLILEKMRRRKDDPACESLAVALKYLVAQLIFDTGQTLMQLMGREAWMDRNPWSRLMNQAVYLFWAGGFQDHIPQLLGERYLTELEFRKLRKFSM